MTLSDPLVGKWFHSFQGGELQWQGQILGLTRVPDHYLVQFYEWVCGSPSDQQLIDAASMIDWRFYDSHEDMNDAFYSGHVHRSGQGREATCAKTTGG